MEAELSVSVQFRGPHRHVNFGPFFFVLRSKCASKCALLHRRGDGVRDSGAGISGLNTAYTYSLWLVDLSAHGVPLPEYVPVFITVSETPSNVGDRFQLILFDPHLTA